MAWKAISSIYAASAVGEGAKYKFFKTSDITKAHTAGDFIINGLRPTEFGSHGSITYAGISKFFATSASLFVC